MEHVEYLNNFHESKIIWDKEIGMVSPTQSNLKDTYYFALDTENTNVDNEKCITYATQLMCFGKKSHKSGTQVFLSQEERVMNLFTHPSKFWKYLNDCPEHRIECYVYNAEYDVNNLLNFAIKEFNLNQFVKSYEESLEYQGKYNAEKQFMKPNQTYTYDKISRNGKIYKCTIQLGACSVGKQKATKTVTIYDMAKKMTGSLKTNVEAFTPLKMNKADLDYSIFRDFGHRDYKEEELLYMWNDVYCLSDLVIEYVFSGKYKHTDKLTTSSMALANYKDELCEDVKDALLSPSNILYDVASQYMTYIKKSKLNFLLARGDEQKYKKVVNKYYDYCSKYSDGEQRFIIEEYFKPDDVFKFIFPETKFDMFDYIINSYCGGITRYHYKEDCGKWINKNGIGVDINSSFPYSYTTFKLPYGQGKLVTEFEELPTDKNKVYICRARVGNFKVKKNKEPNISKVMITSAFGTKKLDTWVKEFRGECIIKCTSADFEYFMKNYSYDYIEVLDYIEFKAKVGFFNRFTNKFYGIKCQKGVSKGIRSWVKLILNGVYGKFGQNKCSEMRCDVYNPDTNSIDDIIVREDDNVVELLSEGVYVALASFVTSYSRLHLLEVLNIINKTKGIEWRYCDTDSAYVTGDVDILKRAIKDYIDIDYTGELGKWKIEKYFDKIMIVGIKKYIYHGAELLTDKFTYHCTLSGINKKYFKFIEKYCENDDMCICELNDKSRDFIKKVQNEEIPYFVGSDENPFIYADKELKNRIIGAYRSIRKKTVIDGQILYASIYCIKGDVK